MSTRFGLIYSCYVLHRKGSILLKYMSNYGQKKISNWQATRAPRGTDRSPEYNERFCYKLDSRVKNWTTEWNEKQQHFITQASRSLVWIRFVAVAFRSEEVFWRRGPPPLALDPPLGQNIFMHVLGHEHFIPTKFCKHPLSSSVVKAGYVFPYIYMH